MSELIKDTEGSSTYLFPRVEGESEADITKKKKAGYSELPQFEGHESEFNFCCYACEYMREDLSSPTGYWCDKFGFADRPHGCSDGFELKPELREYEDSMEDLETDENRSTK